MDENAPALKKTFPVVGPADTNFFDTGGAVASVPQREFEAFYAEHASLVRRILAERGVPSADLDDVVQETFVTVHRLLPDFEGRSSESTWLHAVAWRVAANHRRRRRRAAGASLAPPPEEEADPLFSPNRVQASFERIADEQRDLLALHEIGGLSISSLAELTGNARATIRSRLERGRAALTRAISSRAPRAKQRAWIDQMEQRFAEPSRAAPPPVLEVLPCGQGCLSTIDDIVIAVWRGQPSHQALQTLIETLMAHATRWPSGIRYLAVVERTSSPPTREGREISTWGARRLGPQLKAFATSVEGSALMMLVASLINTSLFLAREPLNVRFFVDLDATLAWLQQYGSVDLAKTLEHVDQMRKHLDAGPCAS